MTLSSFVQASPSPLRLSRSARAWAGGEGGCDGSEMGRGADAFDAHLPSM
jgi:hypothetical protein